MALCATHVIAPNIDALLGGQLDALCVGIASYGAQAWRIRHVTTIPNNDVAILSLEYCAALPPDRNFYQAHITTRSPATGEAIFLAGFRAVQTVFPRVNNQSAEIGVNVLLSTGPVAQSFPTGRDRVMVNWPSLEINCPAWEGMSGGPGFDSRGFLVGLVTASLSTADEPSPTIISLLWPLLVHAFPGGWPANFERLSRRPLKLRGTGTACPASDVRRYSWLARFNDSTAGHG